jgi:hypothetical protein
MPNEYTKKYAAESYETAQGRFKGHTINFYQEAGGSQNVYVCDFRVLLQCREICSLLGYHAAT